MFFPETTLGIAKIYGNDKLLQHQNFSSRRAEHQSQKLNQYKCTCGKHKCSLFMLKELSSLLCYPWPRFIDSILGIPSVHWKIFSYGIQIKLTILIDLTSTSRVHPFLCSCYETVWRKVSYIPWNHHLCYHRWTYAR